MVENISIETKFNTVEHVKNSDQKKNIEPLCNVCSKQFLWSVAFTQDAQFSHSTHRAVPRFGGLFVAWKPGSFLISERRCNDTGRKGKFWV